MHSQAAYAAGRLLACAMATVLAVGLSSARVAAQEDFSYEEPSFTVNGMIRLQGGVFAPLLSSKFKPHETRGNTRQSGQGLPCDVRWQSQRCYPQDHGQKPGTPSIGRMTLQLESQWDISRHVGLHTIVRAVRSMELPADAYARPPQQNLAAWEREDWEGMSQYAEEWVHDNQYTEFDLREFYLDLTPNERVSMRIGRQQIMWGDIGGYRLLDAVNPENTTWHFGPLESVEDVRIPLWMWLTTIDIPEIEHSLELLWVPLIDRPEDTVTTPLSFAGAWGIPISNYPTSFFSPNLNFDYPGGKFKDMRGGFRWKGNVGDNTNYSLVYLYTHQFSPPIPDYGFYAEKVDQSVDLDTGAIVTEVSPNSNVTREIVLKFPRQHIAGFSIEQSIPALATIARLEAAFEPNRTFPGRTDKPNITGYRLDFVREKMLAVNYAVVLQRPTMIRFLNPTQNILFVAQFFHSVIPGLNMDSLEGGRLTQIPGYNLWQLQKHTYRVAAFARTNYLHGKIEVAMTGVYMPNPYAKDSGYYSVNVGFRLGEHYRLNLVVTDFVGKDPYRDLGMFRDRDELLANLTVLF